MIADLNPYPAMKDSGVPWLGDVPEHWEVHRLKYLLREQDSRSSSGKEQLLRVSQYTGVTQRTRSDGLDEPDTRAESLVGYKSVEPDELVVNIMLAWNGSMGVSKFHGIASPAYCVYRFGDSARPWFFHHLLRSPVYKARIKAVSTGVVESRLRLYTDDLYRLEALVPPLPEQAAIVRFLGYANQQIEKAIRVKRKLIALLTEQKQAIIHHAVTRGLDPNVRLKPSGIRWLGDIPEHWEVRPLKQLLQKMEYGTSENLGREGKVRVLTMGHIQDGEIINPIHGSLDTAPAGLRLEKYDLLFNRTNSPELVGKVGLFTGNVNDNITFASYLVRLRLHVGYSPLWLNYVLNSSQFIAYARSQALVSLHQANLNSTRYGQMTIPVPPKPEQKQIADLVSNQITEIRRTIKTTEHEVALLREYRTRLTVDVVTGKLDVREAAKHLPEETGEPEVSIAGAEPGDKTEFEPALSEAV